MEQAAYDDTLSHCVQITSGVMASVDCTGRSRFRCFDRDITLRYSMTEAGYASVRLRAVTFVYRSDASLQCQRSLVRYRLSFAAAAIVTLVPEVSSGEYAFDTIVLSTPVY